tara:strand:- start:9475 stop:10452 length:978 start_codon:yes stop_codon:yes gene_type:complete
MDKILDKANLSLDITLKLFSVLFTFSVAAGALLVWNYFKGVGLGGEVIGLMASPFILFSIAIYGAAIALYILLLMISAPIVIRFIASKELGWDEKKVRPINPFFIFGAVCSPLIYLIIGVALEIGAIPVLIGEGSITLLISVLAFRFYGGECLIKPKQKGESLFSLIFVVGAGILMLILLVIPFSGVVLSLSLSGWHQILLFLILSLGYGACVAFSFWLSGVVSYVPLVLFLILTLGTLFNAQVSENIIKNTGLGGYETNLSIKTDNLAALPKSILHKPASKLKNVSIVESVWVVASLPDKTVLASKANKKEMYTIPTNAILSSW